MRLWHKDLIDVLPQKQLVAQWRECCSIISNIARKGTPNHILVNYVLDFSADEYKEYTKLVINEMKRRGYKISDTSFTNFITNFNEAKKYFNNERKNKGGLYHNIHNKRYFWQCYMNIQEKYDRGMFSNEEFEKVWEKGKYYKARFGNVKY